jgi:hypothetical protein
MQNTASTPALRGALDGRLRDRFAAASLIVLLLLSGPLANVRSQDRPTTMPPGIANLSGEDDENSGFRVETTPVAGGAEIITIIARRSYMDGPMQGPPSDIPLVSVLKDTLGDDKPENDRLRYVWMLTHTRATFKQKLSALVPFLYTRTANKNKVGTEPPPEILDLNASDKTMWNKVFWTIFKRLVFDDIGVGVKASALQYRQNKADYRRSGIAAALAVLSLYQQVEGEQVLSDKELKDIQARLALTEKTFGFMMQSENLGRVYDKETALTIDYRGHNWELLRQYTEAQGLFFEPLPMPDGSARHAIVWVDAADLAAAGNGRKFERRFLNFKSPWGDEKLLNWQGHSEIRWYDAEDREVPEGTPDARSRKLIPLAIYGLDHPKVPVILVDFRDNANPKVREMSRRVLNDLTGNVLSLSRFGGMPFFLGRFVYDFVTGRRGADLNQASRLRSYSQLKLLLALDDSLDRDLKREVGDRIESATLNPLQNDAEAEVHIARVQYDNLLAYAADPDGLPKKLRNDRREEMGRLVHSGKTRALFALGSLFTFGKYAHRETDTPEMLAKLDERRQLDFHERFLREVAFASVDPEIDNRPNELKRSLAFISRSGAPATEKTTRALSKIFSISKDDDIQTLCLIGLYRINSSAAKKELLAIYKNTVLPDRWRDISAHYLRLALQEGQRMSVSDAKAVAGLAAN